MIHAPNGERGPEIEKEAAEQIHKWLAYIQVDCRVETSLFRGSQFGTQCISTPSISVLLRDASSHLDHKHSLISICGSLESMRKMYDSRRRGG
jgi:hypothetical protein